MNTLFKKLNTILKIWYKNTEIPILIPVLILYFFSLILVKTATTSLNLDEINNNKFFIKQSYFILISIIILISCSNLSFKLTIKASYIGLAINIILLLVAILYGKESKGVKRWIYFFNISYQPSEFVRPFFLVVTSHLMSLDQYSEKVRASLAITIFFVISIFLALQPDFSMLVVLSISFFIQILFSNISLKYIIYFLLLTFIILSICVLKLPHISHRIENFLSSDKNKNYQVMKSIAAFKKGGLYGLGPGEGSIKKHLPDSHTDFILSVAAEEFGILAIFFILMIYLFIVTRILLLLTEDNKFNNFNLLSIIGITSNMTLQIIVNISVALNLIPTTGITLPFISYGGSSNISMAISIAIILSLKRKKISLTRYQNIQYPSF